MAGLLSDDDREAALRYFRRIPAPAQLPAYSGLFVSKDGMIWVQASALGDSQTVLSAVTPEGRLLGDIHLPVDVTVFEIGRDYILGAYQRREGEDRVLLYRFGLRK